jgi:acyl carrier protein
LSKFFDELMESVQQMNEIVRSERQPSRELHACSSDRHPTHRKIRLNPSHEMALNRRRPMILAPNFPDDHAMHLLMQLLHEELGLPERKTISLTTSINFDLGCNGADAQHLMEALEEQFGIDFVDYDAYRYFQPEGFDVHLKRRAKGRGDKVPLTIGMLYQTVKVQRWDTKELESQ